MTFTVQQQTYKIVLTKSKHMDFFYIQYENYSRKNIVVIVTYPMMYLEKV